jgi:UDPglucose 6-dehydrogenase
MKIGVIGLGVVGGAVQHGLQKIGNDVKGYDIKNPGTSIDDLLDSDVCFVCVPTNINGENDTSIVEAVVSELAKKNFIGVVAIKSTVIPGTTDRLATQYKDLKLSFCPEFLRERSAVVDFSENMDICPIGVYHDEDFETVREAHGSIPQKVIKLKPKEAEFVKYFSNVFNAMHVVFANEFYEVCKAAGVNYQIVKNCAVARQNIPNVYLDCNENMRGFGGVCLPKDSQAFAAYAKKLGLDVKLFELIIEENNKFPKTVFNGMRLS